MTPAELAFVLIVLRGGSARKTVSDEQWTNWTGKDPKMKQFAIRGLREKGLKIEGKGNKAQYDFDRDTYTSWVSNHRHSERVKTTGRSKTVTAPAGMRIHPDCEGGGCQKLCEPAAKADVISISSAPATEDWKPVSNSQAEPEAESRKPVSNPEPDPPPKSSPKTQPKPAAKTQQSPNDAQFQTLIGIFLSLGVALSPKDLAKCQTIWKRINPAKYPAVVAYATAQSLDHWSEIAERFIPRPWNYLDQEHWERKAATEGRKQSKSKGQMAFDSAAKDFMDEE